MTDSLVRLFDIVWPLLIVMPGVFALLWLTIRDDFKKPHDPHHTQAE